MRGEGDIFRLTGQGRPGINVKEASTEQTDHGKTKT